jgi:class 3 adenylate cyclase
VESEDRCRSCEVPAVTPQRNVPDHSATDLLEQVNASGANVLLLTQTYCTSEYESYWRQDPRLYQVFSRKLASAGHPTKAYELAREGLGDHPGDRRLAYLCAFALARGGNVSKAAETLAPLLADPEVAKDAGLHCDVLSLQGRLAKDRCLRACDPAAKQRWAADAARSYERAYLVAREAFPAINAATMSLIANEPEKARALARVAVAEAESELNRPKRAQDYWLLATLGEANLILEQPAAAASWYQRAVHSAAGTIGDIASMRRNLRLLEQRIPVPDEIRAVFNIGAVVVAAGHMIDHPQRLARGKPPRFPADPELERLVGAAIHDELDRLQATVGYCSVACGTDILFAEKLLERGGELHVVLPFALEDFYQTSVDYGVAEFAGWRRRCDAVLAAAAEIHHATKESFLGDHVLFELVNDFAQGLAVIRAGQLAVEPHALAVVDRASTRAVGGTIHFIEGWRAAGRQAHTIDLAALRCQLSAPASLPTSPPVSPAGAGEPSAGKREVKAMLFGDVKNFSKLREDLAPSFFVHFLNEVADVLRKAKRPPVFCNTWGDGLYAVFDGVVDAADFALGVLERIGQVVWAQFGLPADTTVRIGVHAGPVYRQQDPIIQRENFFGSHVNRAARIEPVTIPGCVYASEQFAALLAIQPDHDFVCEYIGVEQLAKGYDRTPLYRLTRGE